MPAKLPAIGPYLNITRRKLPHWQVGGATYSIRFSLRGSDFQSDNTPWARVSACPTRGRTHGSDRTHRSDRTRQKSQTHSAPLSPEERAIVKRSLLFWQEKKWLVHMLVVMPDHVHLLATPLEKERDSWHHLGEIIKSVKSYSARAINQRRGAKGSLWQPEYYDHIIRNGREFDEWATYIIGNPMNGELVKDAWQYDGLWCEGDGVNEDRRPTQSRSPVGPTSGRTSTGA